MLLNLSSLELIIKDDIDLDKELRLCGTGNIVSGFFGGIVGYQMLGPSALNHALGSKSRIPTMVLIVMSSLMLFWGHDFLKFFPVPLIGAYLLFIGINFLQRFLYDSWVKLPLSEYIIVNLYFNDNGIQRSPVRHCIRDYCGCFHIYPQLCKGKKHQKHNNR